MPNLTIRMTEEELAATDQAAAQQHLTRSEFTRRAITAASKPEKKTGRDFPYGVLKGEITYKQAMKMLRD